MYWLVAILIITAMMGTLTVAESMSVPVHPILERMDNGSIWPLLLLIIATLLLFITQRNTALPSTTHPVHSQTPPSIANSLLVISRYLLSSLLASVLIIGSCWQALSSYQRLETTKVTEPMRVQAWVTIEGISDSVYNPATNSGYRQVATLSRLSPLVSELTAHDLNAATFEYIDNSLSKINNSNKRPYQYRVLLNAYPKKADDDANLASLNHLQPNDGLLMTVALAPLDTSQEAINNPSGFDSYRWLRGRHIDGVATILAVGTPVTANRYSSVEMTNSVSYLKRFRININQWRWQLRQHFYQDWGQKTTAQQQASAVTLSLLTGDRSLINRDTKDLYQLAGISHLLAISGTHILFLAIMLAGAAVLLCNRMWPVLYRHVPRWQVRWWVMISAAFIYALFTGFDVPAARTAWMLLAIGLVRLTLLPISTMRVLLALAVLMAWFDPYVLWQAGYWLSFIAVALLLKYDDGHHTKAKLSTQQSSHKNNPRRSKISLVYSQIWPLFKRIFKLQCWLFIALLPITLLLFGKASLWGLVINLFAIGLFGWVIVPLNLLAGIFYLLSPTVADYIWALVSAIVGRLHELIMWLTAVPALDGAWLYTPVNMGLLLMTLLVILPWVLPRGLISRWLTVPPLALLMMTVYANQQALLLTPTLYVLPTGDRYLSAAVLQYPVSDNQINDKRNSDNNKNSSTKKNSVSWLFLANHRPQGTRTMPMMLTADKLTAILEQQLRTLSIESLEGVVVQTSAIALAESLSSQKNSSKNTISERLPHTVMQLSQSLPTNQYWQAGRSERWSAHQQTYLTATSSTSKNKTLISAQHCDQGKTWQSANGNLSLHALTGWSEVNDVSVWDCSVAIDSDAPIRVVQYDATDPQQSPLLNAQSITQTYSTSANSQHSAFQTKQVQTKPIQSRLILDTATHQRVWQLWSLLCTAKPFAISSHLNNSVTWLSHSASQVSAEILSQQGASAVITYDKMPLESALTLDADP